MFLMHTPKTFRVGDSQDCRINGEAARITWKNAKTLVIEPGDERAILHTLIDGELRVFFCSSDKRSEGYNVEQSPDGVIVQAPKDE